MKASDVEGTTSTGGDALDLWQVYGRPMAVFRRLQTITKEEGRLSLIVESQFLDGLDAEGAETGTPDERVEHWVNGRLAKVFDRAFQTMGDQMAKEGLEGVFWLDAELEDGTKYRGWSFLDTNVTPKAWKIPEKQAALLAAEQMAAGQRARAQASVNRVMASR